jgi:regulator of protease activity HflC (stomatin/prohibitin superfamily)
MGAFFQLLFDKLHEWWPIRIVDAGNQGVKYLQNGRARCLQPGTHFFIPKLQRIEEVGVQYQNVDCGLQSLTTKDGKEITVSLNVGYSITDAALLWTSFQHFDTSLVNMARGHAAEIVCESEWEELAADPQGFGQELQEALHEDVSALGVEIEDVTADQLSRARTYRLLQSQTAF